MKIACITYRSWAVKIYESLKSSYSKKHNFLIIKTKEEYNDELIKSFNPDIILWYGWSWIVEKYFIENYTSIMLHPSPLPKYRGGSPIQNQIINDEKISAVTLFKMTENLDDGDIFFQETISLDGTLDEIFSRIIRLGIKGSSNILDNNFSIKKQNHDKATYCKRRKPEDSEITIHEIKNMSAKFLYNKIRMLNDPYPNAFIRTADNKKLYITTSYLK